MSRYTDEAVQPPSKRGFMQNKAALVSSAAAVVVLAFGGLMYYINRTETKQFTDMKDKTLKFEYRRKHYAAGTAESETKVNPKVEVVFSEANQEKYELGAGFEIPFIVESPQGDETVRTITLKTYETFEEDPSNENRRNTIKTAKGQLKEALADWAMYKSVVWDVEAYIDLTGRWGQPLVDQVTETLDKAKLASFGGMSLKQRIDMGDEVHFVVYKIRDVDFIDGRESEIIPAGETKRGTSEFAKISATLTWVWKTAKKEGTDTSSIATPMFNAMDENKGKPNRVVLAFTDFVENDELTVKMYDRDSNMLAAKEYAKLEDMILSQRKLQSKKLPDLRGVDFYGFGPKTGDAAQTIRLAMDFYQNHLLRLARAHFVKLGY